MAKEPTQPAAATNGASVRSNIDDMLVAALDRGSDSLETGRALITYKDNAFEEGLQSLKSQGFRTADARDFENQAVTFADIGDAETVAFPEIGVVLVGGGALEQHGMSYLAEIASDSPIENLEPEYFVFADERPDSYMRGFLKATETIARDFGELKDFEPDEEETDPQVLGATWGLVRCKVLPSIRSGAGMRVAVLDTGMDLGHPDFVGRQFVTQTFVGQPVQDLHSHGTHCIGTSCGPKAPPGSTPRYGIAFRAPIFVGKVLSNSGSGATGSVLAGMNWAIANRCVVISMSLGSQSPVQAAYTAAGAAALSKGCLIVAAAGNRTMSTGAPANSPTIMSVASLDPNLNPSVFSNFGKIEIAGPGRDVFSSVPRPARYGAKSGTSMATPHVAGCAALWAETSASLRGAALWNKLQQSAKSLPFPASRVGRGLVQAP